MQKDITKRKARQARRDVALSKVQKESVPRMQWSEEDNGKAMGYAAAAYL